MSAPTDLETRASVALVGAEAEAASQDFESAAADEAFMAGESY